MPTDEPSPNPTTREPALAEIQRLRRQVRRLQVVLVLLVLPLAGAGLLAVQGRNARAESRRLAEERALDAERARAEAERQRELAQRDADRLTEQARADAEKARAEAQRAVAKAEAASRNLAVTEYARTLQLAHDAWANHNMQRARELLEAPPSEPRGWEWRFFSSPPAIAPPPRAKE